jgi:hypothetical protein
MIIACDSPATPEELKPCPQTFEFGNYGCARVVVMVEGSLESWPELRVWDVRVIPRRANTAASTNWSFAPGPGAHLITLKRWYYRDEDQLVDTLSVTIKAELHSARRHGDAVQAVELFAADSAHHVMRFVPVGSTPPVDTVRLHVQRVQ